MNIFIIPNIVLLQLMIKYTFIILLFQLMNKKIYNNYMDNKFIKKNGGFPPIKFCNKENNENIKKERFFQNNTVHNINIRQLLSDTNKKTIIVPTEDESLEIVETFNRV